MVIRDSATYEPASTHTKPEGTLIRRLTVAYVGALSLIAILSGSVHLILDGIIARQADSASIINVAGRQRMLSQRTAFLATEYHAHGKEETRQALLAAADLMERSHVALTRGDAEMGIVNSLSQQLRRHYFDEPVALDRRVGGFIVEARRLATPGLPADEAARTLSAIQAAAISPLLRDLDAAVKLFESEANARVDTLRSVQRGVLVILLATLMIEAAFIFRPLVAKVKEFAVRLFHLAMRDSLTGAYNRRAFMDAAERELALARRSGLPMSLIALDVDHFKRINDTHGHDVGDTVLCGVVRLASARLRTSDMLARTGGEEFFVLLPNTAIVAATQVGEVLRALIEAAALLPGGGNITASFGVAELEPGDAALTDLLRRADKALYAAKWGGRNRVVVAEPAPKPELPDASPSLA